MKSIIIAIIGLVLIGCGEENNLNWSGEAQEQYMDECVTNGADRDICQCTMSALDSEYPNLPNLKDSEIDYEAFFTFTFEAALNCYDELGIDIPDTF